MESSLYLLIVLVEWVLLVTLAAPMFLSGRFRKNPTIGIALWILAVSSSIAAVLVAMGIAVSSVFTSYFALQEVDDLGIALITSFAPWILLAFAGILLALGNQRLAPLYELSSKSKDETFGSTKRLEFRRVDVYELHAPDYIAFTSGKAIFLSSAVFSLPSEQFEAVVIHEYAHIKLRHEIVKKFCYLIYRLIPWVVASRAMVKEIELLCEVAADLRALRDVERETLLAARKLFI